MEVLPSTVGFEDGVMFLDGARLAWDSRIESQLAIVRHRHDEAPGIRKLEKTNFDIAIEVTTAGLRLEHDADRKPTISLSGGPGRLSGKIGWHQGSLSPGGTLSLAFPASGNLDGKAESTEATIEMRITDVDIRFKGGQISPGIAHPLSRLCASDLRRRVPYTYRALQISACSPRNAASIRFLFVAPALCLRLPSDAQSPGPPLPCS